MTANFTPEGYRELIASVVARGVASRLPAGARRASRGPGAFARHEVAGEGAMSQKKQNSFIDRRFALSKKEMAAYRAVHTPRKLKETT